MMDDRFTFPHLRVLIRGGGDLASGVAYRLHRAGFPVLITEIETPLAVRRTVAFAEAVYQGEVRIEGITARRVITVSEVLASWTRGEIPVKVDPQARIREMMDFTVVVDAIMAKRNTGTRLTDAPLVVALGPGFVAGVDCHAVVETARGHYLGRVYRSGTALPNTGTPGAVLGHERDRVLRAPCAGHVQARVAIGERVHQGQIVAEVAGMPVYAPFDGVLRGLVHPRVSAHAGMKIGDVDPRGIPDHCFTISEKSLAIGGGVLEAILSSDSVRNRLKDRLSAREDTTRWSKPFT